jgi:precorrin-2 dehydrogenase/sirohydrochlorin ferrochelatase
MLPVVFEVSTLPVLLAGAGPLAVKRLALLDDAGAGDVRVFGLADDDVLRAAAGARFRPHLPDTHDIAGVRLMFVAGLPPFQAHVLGDLARAHRVALNVEDDLPYCDFHMPAMVRRGDLLLTVSTGGGSPALASGIRAWLSAQFGLEWGEHLSEAQALRTRLRAAAARPGEIIAAVRAMITERGWLS